MGGSVAQQVAQARQLAALVLVTSVGPGRVTSIRPDLPVDKPFTLDREQARRMFFHRIDDAAFDDFYPRLVPESPGVLNDYSRGGVVANPDLDCPVLVIEAEKDREVVIEHCRDAADFYRAPLIRVREAGHDLMLEPVAERVAACVCGWLATNVDDGLDGVGMVDP